MRIPYYLILWAGITLFIGLGSHSLYIVDEARNAQAAWEMYASGEWVVPTFNGVLRTDKPPLHYFGMRVAYAVWGKNAWAARFVSAVLGMLLLWVLYRNAKRCLGEEAAFWVPGLLLCSLYFPLQMRLATPDPYLLFFFTVAMLGLWRLWLSPDRAPWLLLGTYAALGLAVLAKGPVAIVLTGLSVLVFLAWNRQLRWSAIARFRPIQGLAVGLVVVFPWLIAVHLQTDGAWTRGFFLEHNVQRFSQTKEGHGGGIWLIPVLMLASMLPFSVLLPKAFKSPSAAPPMAGQFHRYAWSVVLAVAVFFSFSQTKLPSYPAPAYPFMALVLAPSLAALVRGEWRLWAGVKIFWLVLAFALPVGAYLGIKALGEPLPAWHACFLLPVPLLVCYGVLQFGKGQRQTGLSGIALGFGAFFIVLAGYFFGRIDGHNHVQQSLPLLQGQKVVVYQRCTPSYMYYMPAPLPVFQDTASLKGALDAASAPSSCVLVITTAQQGEELSALPQMKEVFRQKDFFENQTTVIYRYEQESCL